MRAIDTNVLIRILVLNDHEQHQIARSFFAGLEPSEQVYISTVALTELVWVLEGTYYETFRSKAMKKRRSTEPHGRFATVIAVRAAQARVLASPAPRVCRSG